MSYKWTFDLKTVKYLIYKIDNSLLSFSVEMVLIGLRRVSWICLVFPYQVIKSKIDFLSVEVAVMGIWLGSTYWLGFCISNVHHGKVAVNKYLTAKKVLCQSCVFKACLQPCTCQNTK